MLSMTPKQRSLVASTWDFRARAERQAHLRFTRLARELEETGAQDVVVQMAQNAAEEEARHAEICDEIAQLYGWETPSHVHPITDVVLCLAGQGKRERLLYELVAFCCFTETLNTAMLVETLSRATDPTIKEALHVIAKDEVKHSQMGWAHLSAERQAGLGGFIGDSLPGMFVEADVEEVFQWGDEERASPVLRGHGELADSDRHALFWTAVEDIFLPGLEAHQIDTQLGRQWLSRFDGFRSKNQVHETL
jgi:hypothetical protein